MRNRLLVSAIALAVTSLVVYFTAAALTKSHVNAQALQWKRTKPFVPFTASLVTRQLTGEALRSGYAQRRDGSFVRLNLTDDLRSTRSIDMADGVKVVVYERLGLKSTVRDPLMFAKWSQANERLVETGCVPDGPSMTFLRNDTVLGRPVKVFSMNPNGLPKDEPGVSSTIWFDPELNCYPVRQEVVRDGKRSVHEAVSITIGDPDSQLFQVDDALEVSPVEAMRRALTKLGAPPCAECERSSVNVRREHYYQDHRPK